MASETGVGPKPILSVMDGVAIMVGIVVGIGIFKTPSLVANSVTSEAAFLAVWVVGGLVTLIGALCYAELASSYPSAGGEYHFLSRAYGRQVAVMFGWARGSVIQTGAIAAVGFAMGDYLAQIMPLGAHGSAIYAAAGIILLTALNIRGTVQGKTAQNVLTGLTISALFLLVLAGLFGGAEPAPASAPAQAGWGAPGMAMIFVLLTFGGWSEAAYLSAEMKGGPRSITRVLLIGTGVLVALYVLLNMAFLASLGLEGIRKSDAVAADLMRAVAGQPGVIIVSLVIAAEAMSTLNGTIFTGARVYYAMARDLPAMRRFGDWRERGSTPVGGLLLQGGIALALVAMGAATRNGFQAMVDYTAPVFWSFMLLVGIALFVLRWREPGLARPFSVPLYPLTPILFCASCAFMLHASLAYTGTGALVGLAVLAAGLPLIFFGSGREPAPAE